MNPTRSDTKVAKDRQRLPKHTGPSDMEQDLKSNCQVSVIVPACGTAENLPTLISRISAVLAGAGMRGEILIIAEDGSAEADCWQPETSHAVRRIAVNGEHAVSSAIIQAMQQARGTVCVV